MVALAALERPALAFRRAVCQPGSPCINLTDRDQQFLEHASTAIDLRNFMSSHLRSAARNAVAVTQSLASLPAAQESAARNCLSNRSSRLACIAGLPDDFPSGVRDQLSRFAYNLLAAGHVLDVCQNEPVASCPTQAEYLRGFDNTIRALRAPSTHGSSQGQNNRFQPTGVRRSPLPPANARDGASGPIEIEGDGTAEGSTRRPPTGGTADPHTLSLQQRSLLDDALGTTRFEPALRNSSISCPFIGQPSNCAIQPGGVGTSTPTLPAGSAAASEVTQNILIREASKYLLRSETIGYLRQAALLDPATEAGFNGRADRLLDSCSAVSELRPELDGLIAAGRDAFAAATPEVRARSREAHHAGAIEAAARLAALDRQNGLIGADYDETPRSLASRWPGWLPGRTVVQIIDASIIGARTTAQTHRACSAYNIGLYDTPLVGAAPLSSAVTRADEWLVSEHFVSINGSRVTDRCAIKNAILEGNAQTMATLLAQYPELGEQSGGRPFFRVLESLPIEQRIARLQASVNNANSPVLSRIRDSVQRLCEHPERNGRALFGDDGFLRHFLSCGGTAPLPVFVESATEARLPPACREIRQNAGAACALRDSAQTRQAVTGLFTGTLGVGMDVVGVYSLAAGAVRGFVTRSLFANVARNFTTINLGTGVGMGLGVGMAYHQVTSANQDAQDQTARYYGGISDLSQYTHAVQMASESRAHAFRDTVLGIVVGHALGSPGHGAAEQPLLQGRLRNSYLSVLTATPATRVELARSFANDFRAELRYRLNMAPADLARLADEDLVAIAEANGGIRPSSSFSPLRGMLAACGSDVACQQRAIDAELFGVEHVQAAAAAPPPLPETQPGGPVAPPFLGNPAHHDGAAAPRSTLPSSQVGGAPIEGANAANPGPAPHRPYFHIEIMPPLGEAPVLNSGPPPPGSTLPISNPLHGPSLVDPTIPLNTPIRVRIAPCCNSISSGIRFPPSSLEYQTPTFDSPGDMYFTGSGRLEPMAARQGFSYTPPEVIHGGSVPAITFEITSQSHYDRLRANLGRGRAVETNTTYVASGSMSAVYYIHPDIPPGVVARINAAPVTAQMNMRKAWAAEHATHVIKVRTNTPFNEVENGLETAATMMRRDLAVYGLAQDLTSHATYEGERLIRVAEITSTNAQHSVGIIEQEVVRGVDAYSLAIAVERLTPHTSNYHSTVSVAAAEATLRESGLNLIEARNRLAALEEFYRRTYTDVRAFELDNGLHSLANRFRAPGGGLRPRLPSGQRAMVGFDLNHGVNVIWSPTEHMFIMIDW